jgi:predicted lipid-binding transport protein (Tim44 family)
LLGGLVGVLLGQGFGGLAGMFGFLVQALLIGGAIVLGIRFFRSQSSRTPAMAGAPLSNGAAGFGRGDTHQRQAPMRLPSAFRASVQVPDLAVRPRPFLPRTSR